MNLIFDIGCNRGVFTQIARAKHKDVKIVAVDANNNFAQEFEHMQNVEFVNCAISDESGKEVEFNIDPRNTGISTLSEWWMKESRFSKGNQYLAKNSGNWSQKVKVKTKTIDDLIEEYDIPDLIKIDLEGYEYEALSSLSQQVPKICFEFAEEAKSISFKCLDKLKDLGYNKFGVIGYFHENIEDFATFEEFGDAHLIEPDRYFEYEEFIEYFDKFCDEDRAINWGMVWSIV